MQPLDTRYDAACTRGNDLKGVPLKEAHQHKVTVGVQREPFQLGHIRHPRGDLLGGFVIQRRRTPSMLDFDERLGSTRHRCPEIALCSIPIIHGTIATLDADGLKQGPKCGVGDALRLRFLGKTFLGGCC
jgi:hypothetical protein